MGLDMSLYRMKLADAEKDFDKAEKEEVIYWRKANQIRQWFVENCDYPVDGNCEWAEVTKENLETLIEDCQNVLDRKVEASEVLPTSSGFFFGSTSYDEYYLENLRHTIECATRVLETTDFDTEVLYYTDWW